MRRIEIISNLFSPDQLGGAALYTDMASYFKEAGWTVRVTTTFSYYPAWKVNEEDRKCFKRVDLFEDIEVTRLKIYVPSNPSGVTRILFDLSFLFSLLCDGAVRSRKGHAVITACPMLSQSCYGKVMDLKRYGPVLLIVQDIASGAAESLGILKGNGFLTMVQRVEEWCLSACDVLSSIAPQMVKILRNRMENHFKVPVVYTPNWVHKALAHEIQYQNHRGIVPREKRQLFYSGNLGVKQALDKFVEEFANERLGDWQLEIRGNGVMQQRVVRLAESCERITVGLPQSEAKYVSSLLKCTACVITQKSGGSDSFFASKILPALATGTPILVVGDSRTSLACIVRDFSIGEVVEFSSDALQDVLKKWEETPTLLESYSSNALKLSREYTSEKVLSRYQRIIESKYRDERSVI